jgi:intracellular sulfur oxidation DsrE/DsrF family protein
MNDASVTLNRKYPIARSIVASRGGVEKEIVMNPISRRSFVTAAAAGIATLAAPVAADAELLYKPGEWQEATFDDLLHKKYEIKQLFDVTVVDDGNAFDHMVNALNGLEFGFGIPGQQIKIVGALRGMATVMNFNDTIWEKYKLGEWAKVDDPKTKKRATRNIFYTSDYGNPAKYPTQDPNEEKSYEQDSSIQALQTRGVQLLACHMAVEFMARGAIKRLKLKDKPETLVQEIQSNLLPNVLVVPSMVSAIPMLETKGHFTYIRM